MSRAGADRYRDLVNTPGFLAVLPPVDGLRVLDVGCGEGHNTRLLGELGAAAHCTRCVRDLRSSGTWCSDLDRPSPRRRNSLPFPDAAFDAATAFMSVMDMPDPAATIAEVARVVRSGGWFQFSITHPLSSVPRRRWIDDEHGERSMLATGGYFDEGRMTDRWSFGSAPPEMLDRHEPFTITWSRLHRVELDQPGDRRRASRSNRSPNRSPTRRPPLLTPRSPTPASCPSA